MKLISIDSSTKKTALSVFENGKYIEHILIDHSKEKDVEKRIDKMGKDILVYLSKNKPDIIIAEHPQGAGSNVSMVGKLCEILGIIRAYKITKNIEYVELMPSMWRSYLGWSQGKKKRDELKQMSIDYIRDKYNMVVSDDEADSISLGEAYITYCNNMELQND